MNICNYIKSHPILFFITFGASYWGVKLIQCISKKWSATVEKTDQVSREVLEPVRGFQRRRDIIVQKGMLYNGNGDFVVYKINREECASFLPLDKAEFSRVYPIIRSHRRFGLDRYEELEAKVRHLDPNYRVAFVPRTLLELCFIRKAIWEDIKGRGLCQLFKRYAGQYEERSQVRGKCFHKVDPKKVCIGAEIDERTEGDLNEVAYRINKSLIKKIPQLKDRGAGTYEEFRLFAGQMIDSIKKLESEGQKFSDCQHSLTTGFLIDSSRGASANLFITEYARNIILNCVALDCSQLALTHYPLLRGSDFQKDSAVRKEGPSSCVSLSFGASLFAGVLYDPGACAYKYMRAERDYCIPVQEASVIFVSFDKLQGESCFYFPSDSYWIKQLYERGEYFHPRTKIPNQTIDYREVKGLTPTLSPPLPVFYSNPPRRLDDLEEEYQSYKRQSFDVSALLPH